MDLREPIKGSAFPLHCPSLTLLKNGQDPLVHQKLAVDLTALLHRRQGDGLALVSKLHLTGEVSGYESKYDAQQPSTANELHYNHQIICPSFEAKTIDIQSFVAVRWE